jgi:UDP-N-acetylmuramoyl-tripeptide--D-alanyl-D-alanine ligase
LKLADVVIGTKAEVYRTTVNGLAQGVAAGSQLAEELDGFTADSRSVSRGELFFALPGERVDGHAFVSTVLNSGAAGAVVSKTWLGTSGKGMSFPPNRWLLATDEPLNALQNLASYWRSKHDVTVVGVTGSVGKTTIKEITAQTLEQGGSDHVLKTTGNLNSEVGMPLELLRLNDKHRVAVLEMGMYQRGEIALLARIAQPAVGIVANVQPNHLERTGSIEATALAKAELVQALPEDGLAVLNGDDALVRLMHVSACCPVTYYGLATRFDTWADGVESLGREGFTARVRHGTIVRDVACPIPGAHHAINILPAIATARYLGLSWDGIVEAIRTISVHGRLAYISGINGSTLIDDRYNASGTSVVAALKLLHSEPGRRLALLGDMYELGPEEEAQHRLVGREAAYLDHLILIGERTSWVADEAIRAGLSSGRIVSAAGNEDAVAAARAILASGDTMLIKGSRGLHLEEVVAALSAPSVEAET